MKIIKIFVLLILITSCSDKKTEKPLTEFDKIIGKENSETINELIAEFENDFLKRQYPNLNTENAYLKFVTDISKANTEHFVEHSKKARELFDNSKLRLEIYCVMDSTWIEKNPYNDITLLVKGKTKCLNPDGTFERGSMEMPFNEKEISKDSIKKQYMNFVEANFNGKYLKALNSISDESEFLSSFVKDRNDLGIIIPEFIAKRMLAYKVNMNDYYIKRIIITELGF
jgi:hypothetical protein